jgi:hypothetical protein
MLSLLALPACQNRNSEATAPASSTSTPAVAATATLSPEQLGELGAQIAKDPAHANDRLTEHHLTRASFEKAIRGVTENADASKRYAAAYRRASA